MALPSLRAVSLPLPRPETTRLPPLPRRRAVVIAEKPSLEISRSRRLHLECSISRRDAMCAATSLVATLLVTKPAEARRIKAETRQKIREKLDKLREKAGLLNKKPDSSADGKENGAKETSPALLNGLTSQLVEAAF